MYATKLPWGPQNTIHTINKHTIMFIPGYTCGRTLECSLGVKRSSHRNPMHFFDVSVDGVFESVHRGNCYNLLWESIPCVNNTLTEVVLSDLKS